VSTSRAASLGGVAHFPRVFGAAFSCGTPCIVGATIVTINQSWTPLICRLEGVGQWLAPLGLRVLLAWEFYESGREKLGGQNWFGDIHTQFPLPFNLVPVELSWALATWLELLGSIALLIGLCTRLVAFSLFVLTIVATAAVHWPKDWMNLGELAHGYAISDMGHGNYKLPLIFLVLLLSLILRGAGRLSIDALIARFVGEQESTPLGDHAGWGIALLALGLPLAMLLPLPGLFAAAVGAALLVLHRWRRKAELIGVD
jgi:putative oxidoreductase